MERRWRAQLTLPPLVDLKTIQESLHAVMQALLDDRIDEDYAGELLHRLEKESERFRG